MKTAHRPFSGKLLLFGEHVLLLGASALAVPVSAFSGEWVLAKGHEDPHRAHLLAFAQSPLLQSIPGLDTAQFYQDIVGGWSFQSNIPTGYGLGSSGALCAAVYDLYAREKSLDLMELKAIFAQMEGFFHGNSSGLDPLTSYIGKPILVASQDSVRMAEPVPWRPMEQPTLLLLDSQLPRQTGPLVAWFLAKSKEPDFANWLASAYLPVHEALIQHWLKAESEAFWSCLREISSMQWTYFAPLIPATLFDFWQQNRNNPALILKICGAGGGGFVLAFARNAAVISDIPSEFSAISPL